MVAGLQPDKAPRKDFINILQKSGNAKDRFQDPQGPSIRDLRLNTHLGAGEIMTPDAIQDPEGATTLVVSCKTAAGATTAIQRQTLRFVCYNDTTSGRLKINMAATTGGKKNPSLHGRQVMLIYRTHMHPEALLDPEHYTLTSDARARRSWLYAHIKTADKYENVYSPEHNEGDAYMEEDTTHTKEAAADEQGLPSNNLDLHNSNAREENDRKVAAEHFNMVPPAAPLQPISFAVLGMGQTARALSGIEINNPYDLLAQ